MDKRYREFIRTVRKEGLKVFEVTDKNNTHKVIHTSIGPFTVPSSPKNAGDAVKYLRQSIRRRKKARKK